MRICNARTDADLKASHTREKHDIESDIDTRRYRHIDKDTLIHKARKNIHRLSNTTTHTQGRKHEACAHAGKCSNCSEPEGAKLLAAPQNTRPRRRSSLLKNVETEVGLDRPPQRPPSAGRRSRRGSNKPESSITVTNLVEVGVDAERAEKLLAALKDKTKVDNVLALLEI